jgi:hypothetical protein
VGTLEDVSARSSVGLECLTTDQEAGGSSPSGRIEQVKRTSKNSGVEKVVGRVAQLVRALR